MTRGLYSTPKGSKFFVDLNFHTLQTQTCVIWGAVWGQSWGEKISVPSFLDCIWDGFWGFGRSLSSPYLSYPHTEHTQVKHWRASTLQVSKWRPQWGHSLTGRPSSRRRCVPWVLEPSALRSVPRPHCSSVAGNDSDGTDFSEMAGTRHVGLKFSCHAECGPMKESSFVKWNVALFVVFVVHWATAF